jgi:hypothetical protein
MSEMATLGPRRNENGASPDSLEGKANVEADGNLLTGHKISEGISKTRCKPGAEVGFLFRELARHSFTFRKFAGGFSGISFSLLIRYS